MLPHIRGPPCPKASVLVMPRLFSKFCLWRPETHIVRFPCNFPLLVPSAEDTCLIQHLIRDGRGWLFPSPSAFTGWKSVRQSSPSSTRALCLSSNTVQGKVRLMFHSFNGKFSEPEVDTLLGILLLCLYSSLFTFFLQ